MHRVLLPLLLLALAPCATAEEEIVTARLSWEPGIVGGITPGSIPFRAHPPKEVLPLEGLTNPRYARIKMAGGKGLTIAFDALADAPRLWVDHDFDGNLKDSKQTHLRKASNGWFRHQVVLARYDDE